MAVVEYERASHTRRGPGPVPASGSRPVRSPAPGARVEGPLTEGALLQVQQAAGNAAATALVQRQPESPDEVPATEAGTPAAATSDTTLPERRTLRFGSTGEDVKLLQMKLHQLREREHDRDANRRSRKDGIFGPLTRQDVIDFQGDTGLDADGVVGPRTWNAVDSLVPGTPTESGEAAADEQFDAARALRNAARYDEAIAIFEALAAGNATPDVATSSLANAGVCHQQRGRFGIAVARYEQALAGRFNQEALRAQILEDLEKARRNELLDQPPPDPEPLPAGADAATATGREGGGVTEREPVKSGDSGTAVDLFKGKLLHVMVGWTPDIPEGDTFDPPTAERTRSFQDACGLTPSGEADASTWHALDSFSKADVPLSLQEPMRHRFREGVGLSKSDPAGALSIFESTRDQAQALGLTEIVKFLEGSIGRQHRLLSNFPEAINHLNLNLARNIPNPVHLGAVLEELRKARASISKE